MTPQSIRQHQGTAPELTLTEIPKRRMIVQIRSKIKKGLVEVL